MHRSPHAHIVLWIHDDDREAACSKIRSCVPARWRPMGASEDDDAAADAELQRDTAAAEADPTHPKPHHDPSQGYVGPCDSGGAKGEWVPPPADPVLLRRYFRITERKQVHVCKEVFKPGCRKEGNRCSGHFPQPRHLSKAPFFDEDNICYRYYCPRFQDRNIGPHIPELLLIMNSHQNVQRIIDTCWSFYLLK